MHLYNTISAYQPGAIFLCPKGGLLLATSFSPITSGYTQSIRQNLINQGVKDSDIGLNKSTGFVTVGGKDAIKAPKTYNGTAYTTKQGFNDDWSNYQKSLQQPTSGEVNTAGVTTGAGTTATTGATQYDPYKTNNPYDTQFNDLLKSLMDQAKNPAPIDVNAIYASPQYAAFQAQAQKGAQQGIRSAQEALGSAGFGRSTALGERAQGIQNDANEYLSTQVLPQLMAQEAASRQQQLQNQFGVLDQLMGQQGVFDNRFNNANQYALNKGELTGNFLDPQAASLIDKILQDKQAYSTATTPEERARINQSATSNRNQLAAMGIDPAAFGANKTLEQAQSGMSGAGVKTLGAQSLEMQKAQQEWDNAFAQGQFDFQKAQTAWENAFKDKSFDQSVKDAAASRGLQWANLNQNQQEFIANQAFRDKQFAYQMDQDAKAEGQNKFNQGMETFQATGKMPDYMKDYGIDISGMNDPGIKEDLNAMYGQISSGADPKSLLKTIDDKVSIGIEDKANGDKLKNALYILYPDLDPSKPKKTYIESTLDSNSLENLSQGDYWLKKWGFK
jgi:hypothetical protein